MTTETTTPVNPLAEQINGSRTLIVSLIEKANASATAVRAAQNTKSALSDLLKESDDPVLVKYRELMEQAQAQMNKWTEDAEKHASANLLPKSDVDVEAERKNYAEAKAAVNGLVNALKVIGGEDAVKDLPDLLSVGRSGSASAGQTGIKRPRVDRIRMKDAASDTAQYAEVKSVKKNDDGTEKVTVSFTVLAQKIKSEFGVKVDAKTIYDHAVQVAGPYDNWGERNGEPFEFVVSIGDEHERHHVSVEVTPQASE